MKIVYACDDHFAPLAAISAVSLLKHNPGAEIILLGYRLKSQSKEIVRTRVERSGGRFRFLDASPAIARLEAINANSYVSYAVYSRIFIPELLGDETGRLLYLDCDTLVVDSLEVLLAIDLCNRPLALGFDAAHPTYKRVISLPADKPYYNTGVMVIDLSSWRAAKCTERLLAELQHPHGHNPLGDQDIIVRALNDEIIPLDARWNFLSQFILTKRKEKPAIYHFSGNTLGRPWFTSSKHPLREAYRKAASEAGLPEAAEQIKRMPFEYKLQYWLFRILPNDLFKPVCNLMYRTHIRLTYGV